MNPDDPKFTAHALGEFEDLTAAERAEIEALLASDPAALAEAEETRTLAARLRAELTAEEGLGALHEEQRAAVFSAATSGRRAPKISALPIPAPGANRGTLDGGVDWRRICCYPPESPSGAGPGDEVRAAGTGEAVAGTKARRSGRLAGEQ